MLQGFLVLSSAQAAVFVKLVSLNYNIKSRWFDLMSTVRMVQAWGGGASGGGEAPTLQRPGSLVILGCGFQLSFILFLFSSLQPCLSPHFFIPLSFHSMLSLWHSFPMIWKGNIAKCVMHSYNLHRLREHLQFFNTFTARRVLCHPSSVHRHAVDRNHQWNAIVFTWSYRVREPQNSSPLWMKPSPSSGLPPTTLSTVYLFSWLCWCLKLKVDLGLFR